MSSAETCAPPHPGTSRAHDSAALPTSLRAAGSRASSPLAASRSLAALAIASVISDIGRPAPRRSTQDKAHSTQDSVPSARQKRPLQGKAQLGPNC